MAELEGYMAVQCPKCQAAPGVRCYGQVGPDQFRPVPPHTERRRVAIDARMQEPARVVTEENFLARDRMYGLTPDDPRVLGSEKALTDAETHLLQHLQRQQEELREIRHRAWIEGYEACAQGYQKHSPYRRDHYDH